MRPAARAPARPRRRADVLDVTSAWTGLADRPHRPGRSRLNTRAPRSASQVATAGPIPRPPRSRRPPHRPARSSPTSLCVEPAAPTSMRADRPDCSQHRRPARRWAWARFPSWSAPVSQAWSRASSLVTSRSFSTGDLDLLRELQHAGCDVRTGPPDHDLAPSRPLLASPVCWIAGTGPVTAAHLDPAADLQAGRPLRRRARRGRPRRGPRSAASSSPTPRAPTPRPSPTWRSPWSWRRSATSFAGDREVRHGAARCRRARELGSLTVGLVGFGRIGQAVARRLRGRQSGARPRPVPAGRPPSRRPAPPRSPLDVLLRAERRPHPARPRRRGPRRRGAAHPGCAGGGPGQRGPRRPGRRAGRGRARCVTGRLAALRHRRPRRTPGPDGPAPRPRPRRPSPILILHVGGHTVAGRRRHGPRCRRGGPRRPRRPEARRTSCAPPPGACRERTS